MQVDLHYARANGITGVMCDGEFVPYAILADSEEGWVEGWVEHYVEGDDGRFAGDIAVDDIRIARIARKYGKIEFIYSDEEDQEDGLANFEA